jgi:hypothetical protein
MGIAAPQGALPDQEQQAEELARAADVQLRGLEHDRETSTDSARNASIDRQIAAISRDRDAVRTDLAEQSPLLDDDVSNLEYDMQSAALMAPSVHSRSPIRPPADDMRPGGYITLPPSR